MSLSSVFGSFVVEGQGWALTGLLEGLHFSRHLQLQLTAQEGGAGSVRCGCEWGESTVSYSHALSLGTWLSI